MSIDLRELINNLFIPGASIVEKVVRPVAVYGFLVIVIRIGGQRALAQLNAFDLVVLLTLSNTVQNAIIGNDNSLLGGVIGGLTLVLVNLFVVHFFYHHTRLNRAVEGEPIELVRDGTVLDGSLHRALVTRDELRAAIHRQGVMAIEDCEHVILETSGTMTVIARRPTTEEATAQEIVARLDRIERLLGRAPGQVPTESSS